MTFEAVIFDCDGVLIDSEKIIVEVHLNSLAAFGLVYERDDYINRYMGIPNRDYRVQLQADAAARNIDWPEDAFPRMRETVWARYRAELSAIDGVAGFAEGLERPMAVASSSETASLDIKLKMTGLYELFAPHIYSGDLVEHGKPAPDLFLHAAQKLGTDPARCLVIEDSPNGVKAGRAAGMTVFGFTGGGHADDGLAARLSEAGAHDVCASFAQIEDRIKRD